ncbi:MAG: magnesium transporter CorA family protein [Clostridiales bacterium]|nr:magnesium transporter CorA family protein [Clostridiales bacterium]
MVEIFMTVDNSLLKINEIQEGCWISLTNPTVAELQDISEKTDIDINHLRAPLDEEERARIEVEDDYNIIVVDIPTIEKGHKMDRYITIPLGIILSKKFLITICLEETPILKIFKDGRIRNFYTYKKSRFILQILYRNATTFLQNLRTIDRKSDEIERKLHISTQNSELIDLLDLEKSLVYFTTSLRSNEVVLEKMLKIESIKQYPEDEELLQDVIIENKQAIEMANIYSGILSGTMDAFASIISNNQNIVMKFLTAVTIVLSIPTMIASFYGMNFVNIPGGKHPYGFYIATFAGLLITFIIIIIFKKKKLF